MKKLLCILMASAFIMSGCSNTKKPDTLAEEPQEENKVLGTTTPGTYSTNDFALYTLDDENYISNVVAVLGVDPDTVEYTDDKAEEASRGVTVNSSVIKTTNDAGTLKEENLISSYSFDGSRIPLSTAKGIMTTGIYITDTDKNCSKAEDVIKAYKIDEQNEEYMTNINDDGSYTIDLYFTRSDDKGSTERIISPKGTDISALNAGYSLRFYIMGGYVHGISAQMY